MAPPLTDEAPLAAVRNVAIFDLDRTITRAATFTPFLLSARTPGPGRALLLARFLPHMALYKAGQIGRKTLKNRMMALALAAHDCQSISALAEIFVAKTMKSGLHREAIAMIEQHRAAGDALILATASVDFYAERFSALLGLDACVSSRTDFLQATGAAPQIIGENCYGEAKRAMVAAKLNDMFGSDWRRLHVTFYTDHRSDLPLLESVDAPYIVNPKAKMKAHADKAGWPVVYWTSDVAAK